MKRPVIFLLFSAISATMFAASPEIPREASEFAIQTGPGKYTWLNQYEGKTVILAFILTDCSHCQFTTGLLNGIQKDYADRGVEVVASAIETMSALHIPDFVAKFKPAFPVGYDDLTYAAKFLGYPENDPMLMPQVVFIDRTGMIRAQFTGDDTRLLQDVQDKTLRDTLDQMLKGALQTQKRGRQPLGHPPQRNSDLDNYCSELLVPCIGWPITSPLTTISTRRFCWRPAAVSFEATGPSLPSPTAWMLPGLILFEVR